MLSRAHRRSGSSLLLIGTVVASSLTALPAGAAAPHRCNNGGAISVHRCTELAAFSGSGTAPNADVQAGNLSLSGDGSVVVFATSATDVPGALPGQQVYLRLLDTGTVVPVSVGATGGGGDGPSYAASVSDDGNIVAFLSDANNLVTLDPNTDNPDAFVRDVSNGQTRLLTPGPTPLTGANDVTTDITVSGDGNRIAYVSLASNLVANDTNGSADIFVVDDTATNLRLASSTAGGVPGNNSSYKPALSETGRYLAFASEATNLIAGDTNGMADVFVKDLQTDVVTRVSVGPGGVQLNGRSGLSGVSISDDGRYVAFATEATNLGVADPNGATPNVVVHDRTAGTTSMVAPSSQAFTQEYPLISGDGSIVLFQSKAADLVAGDTNGSNDIFLAGRGQAAPLKRVIRSKSTNGSETQISSGGVFPQGLSDDGSIVVFKSDENLVAADTAPNSTDIYLHIFDLRAPTVTAPTDALVTNDSTPALTAQLTGPGNSLEVTEGATVVATVPTTAPGKSIATSLPALADGSHTLTFREADRPYVGPAVTRTITVDTAAPQGLAITSPGNGSTIGNAQPSISGTAGTASGDDATLSLSVFDAGMTPVVSGASVAVEDDGTWTYLPAAQLPGNGTYSVSVSQGDHAGNGANAGSSFTLAAGTPTVTITSPVSGSTNTATHTISGTLSDASQLTLTIVGPGGTENIPVTATAGAWSVDHTFSQDGTYSISASATNIAGTGTSGVVSLVVDAVAPLAPVITSPASGAVLATSSPLVTGTSEAGATVHLTIDGSPALPAPVASGSGAWSFQATGLGEGPHVLTAAAEDGAGNVGPTTTRNFSVDSLPPSAPVISSPISGSLFTSPSVPVHGTGEPGATVRIYEGATLLASGTVSASGNWSASSTFTPGAHTVHATQTDAASQTSVPSSTVSFTVDLDAVGTEIASPLQNSVVESRNVSVSGRTVANGEVSVFRVGADGEVLLAGPVAANASGSWSATVRIDSDGTVTLRARESGGSVSAERTFHVRTGVPTITAPVNGQAVPATFTAAGTAKPNATVTLREGSTVLGTVSADGTGAWSIKMTRPQGNRSLVAHAGSGATRTEDSNVVSFLVDSQGPSVTIAPAANVMGATLTATPTKVSGTANDASAVASITIVYENMAGQRIETTSAACPACGTSSSVAYSDSPALTPGAWTATATATDVLGNRGISATTRFVVLA